MSQPQDSLQKQPHGYLGQRAPGPESTWARFRVGVSDCLPCTSPGEIEWCNGLIKMTLEAMRGAPSNQDLLLVRATQSPQTELPCPMKASTYHKREQSPCSAYEEHIRGSVLLQRQTHLWDCFCSGTWVNCWVMQKDREIRCLPQRDLTFWVEKVCNDELYNTGC